MQLVDRARQINDQQIDNARERSKERTELVSRRRRAEYHSECCTSTNQLLRCTVVSRHEHSLSRCRRKQVDACETVTFESDGKPADAMLPSNEIQRWSHFVVVGRQ
jgi:hypothetical protein